MTKMTAETLRRDRERRDRVRARLADAYDCAADTLDAIRGEHREAVELLRGAAESWRRPSDWRRP